MHIRIEEHDNMSVYKPWILRSGNLLVSGMYSVTRIPIRGPKMEYYESHPARGIAGYGTNFLHGLGSDILTWRILVDIPSDVRHS
jgi:hypothetical protein